MGAGEVYSSNWHNLIAVSCWLLCFILFVFSMQRFEYSEAFILVILNLFVFLDGDKCVCFFMLIITQSRFVYSLSVYCMFCLVLWTTLYCTFCLVTCGSGPGSNSKCSLDLVVKPVEQSQKHKQKWGMRPKRVCTLDQENVDIFWMLLLYCCIPFYCCCGLGYPTFHTKVLSSKSTTSSFIIVGYDKFLLPDGQLCLLPTKVIWW